MISCLGMPFLWGHKHDRDAPLGGYPKARKLDAGEMVEQVKDTAIAASILIAEDEELIRMMMVDVLRDEHFDVWEAQDGATALQQLAAIPNVSLLLTDVGLPDLNGRELVERARAARPGLKVIFVTGYTRETLQQQKAPDGSPLYSGIEDIPILRKPFDLTELVEKVREILG